MDRNGKKAKAIGADTHPERSDTKAQARDVLGRMNDDAARTHGARGEDGAANGGGKRGTKGQRR